jgi:hypothetical protein
MAYTITLTDGTVFATITDGTVNTSSSVTLIGKNYAGYGDFLDENFVQMLENFSSDSSGGNPTSSKLAAPLTGQLWWDKTNNLLKVYSGTAWKTISAATSSATTPSNNVTGDLWFDTTNQQLKVWTGAAFLVVGPAYSASQGTSGAIPETILDSVGATKYITSLYVNNNRVGIVYDGASFVPQASLLATFPTIYPGITLTTTNSPIFAGTANNASYLNSLASSQFMRSDTNTSTTGTLRVLNNTGLYVGTSNVLNISQNSNDANVTAAVSGGNIVLQANVGGTIYDSARVLGANGTFAISNAATVGTTLGVTANITGGNILTAGLMSATGNVTGGNVIATAALNAISAEITANVQAGNLRTAGQVSATGNITSAGNVTGTYILGNGSQLSGLSAAVSVSKVVNGTSEANIGGTNGNCNITIGGISNVAVFTTTGAVFTNVTTPAIEKSGTNAQGNIGSTSSWFNRLFAAVVNSTSVSASGNVLTAGLMSATGNVTGGNLISAAAISGSSVSASGNVTGAGMATVGNVSATGNVFGSFFVGNGSLLTGVNTSTTRVFNGTSEINIPVSNGNANVTIGGTANVAVLSTSGLFVTGVTSVTGNVTGGNITTAGQVVATANVSGGNITTAGQVSSTGNITGGNLSVGTGTVSVGNIVNTNGNGVGNIGSSTTYFNRVFATATTALYADVAERFAADEYLEAGTVVELGGSAEITRSRMELSENIFGVISTNPAYLMNGGAGQDSTHPPVAMTGRVPVRVVGAVRKGDRMVSAGNGYARAALPGEATAFNVIGRSLEDKFNVDAGYVEAIVTIK